MKLSHLLFGFLMAGVPFSATLAQSEITFNIDAVYPGAPISPGHYGIFFEEINHAGDGGLYAEMISNRSFDDTPGESHWEALGNAQISIDNATVLNAQRSASLLCRFSGKDDGVKNDGFWGMNIVKDEPYSFYFWLKSDTDWESFLKFRLLGSDGEVIGESAVTFDREGYDGWKKYKATVIPAAGDPKGAAALVADKEGMLHIGFASLFPATFRDRKNGCRKDLAQLLADMNPAFMRFPGGCFVEGCGTKETPNRFEWKKTIGPVEERPGHMNVNWNYRVTDGLGFHEMLQLSEDLGAEPLFVVNVGLGHGWMYPYYEIQDFIQEALDAIEYCNGDATTTWGKKRIENGHPEPFNLRLLEIGNENYNFSADNNNDQSDHYAQRYKKFYDAIHAEYPEIYFIGNVEAWGTDNPSWRNGYPVDALDEHYYRNPGWFENNYSKYDSYDREGPEIYVGEYAVTSDFGINGNLNAALGEAVFMLGMENNSDIVTMNSYAPIFVNENDQKWKPDMIRFDTSYSYGTPSYHVQKMMANNVGRRNTLWNEEGNTGAAGNKIGLSTWVTTATYDNVKVTDGSGNLIFADDFDSASGKWVSNGGAWSISGGSLVQSDPNMQGLIYFNETAAGENYTLELDATKNSGAEGFLIAFNYQDAENFCWWNLGGWGNTQHAIEVCRRGAKYTAIATPGALETGRTYRIKIEVRGEDVKCYLDGQLIFEVQIPVSRKLYFASSIDRDEDTLYVKIVNPGEKTQTARLNILNATPTAAEALVLESENGYDENTAAEPCKVFPKEKTVSSVSGNTVTFEASPWSLSILKIRLTDYSSVKGVEENTGSRCNEGVYTLDGRLVLKDAASLPSRLSPGIYIIGDKKVAVK